MKTVKIMIQLVMVISILTLVITGGCKKEEPSTMQQSGTQNQAAKTEQSAVTTAAQIEQKMCPVMTDMVINPDIFTEYEGKKVYFCCTDCKAKFEADPAKYVTNLPQFKK